MMHYHKANCTSCRALSQRERLFSAGNEAIWSFLELFLIFMFSSFWLSIVINFVILNHGLCGPTDLGKAALSENVSPFEEVGNSDDEISSSEDEGVVAQPVVNAWANNVKTQGKEISRPRSEKEMDINVGPQGRFWKSKGKPGALLRKSQQCCDQVYTPGYMRSLSESSMLKPGLNLEVVLGCNKGSTDQVIHTEVGPIALLNKGLNKTVTVRKEGNNNRNRKGEAPARDEHGEQQRDFINNGEKAQPEATIEPIVDPGVEQLVRIGSDIGKKDPQSHVPSVYAQSPANGRDKGKKVAVAFVRSTRDQLLLENGARVKECGQVSGSKIKGQRQKRMRKLRSTHQFC